MKVLNQTNNYQMMNQYQKPVTLPTPIVDNISIKDIYNASHGNLIKSKNGNIILTPQDELNLAKKNEATDAKKRADTQAKESEQRAYAADYLSYKSKKSQVEIYLAVATNSKISLEDDKTISIIKSLRDVQKQNNAIKAYATYMENQNGDKPVLY
jgi:PAB1-binding protein PBP1